MYFTHGRAGDDENDRSAHQHDDDSIRACSNGRRRRSGRSQCSHKRVYITISHLYL